MLNPIEQGLAFGNIILHVIAVYSSVLSFSALYNTRITCCCYPFQYYTKITCCLWYTLVYRVPAVGLRVQAALDQAQGFGHLTWALILWLPCLGFRVILDKSMTATADTRRLMWELRHSP